MPKLIPPLHRGWILLPALSFFLQGCGEIAQPLGPERRAAVYLALSTLEVGETVSLRGTDLSEILFQGGEKEFLLVPFHSSTSATDRLHTVFTGTGLGSPKSATTLAARVTPSAHEGEISWRMHENLVEAQRQEIASFLRDVPRSIAEPGVAKMKAVPEPGTLIEVNAAAVGPMCETRDPRWVRVEKVSERAILAADVSNPPGGFGEEEYDGIAQEIDRVLIPMIENNFGDVTDIDENDRILVVFTSAVNQLTTPGIQGYVGGFFWYRDLLSKTHCASSNESEILFLLAPDPMAEASHLPHSRETAYRLALGTIAHELQHLVNAGGRLRSGGSDAIEEVWLDEGLSHIAEEMAFYGSTSLPARGNYSAESLTPSQMEVARTYLYQNVRRYGYYLSGVAMSSPLDSWGGLGSRGAAWSFLRYLADHSALEDAEFFRRLVQSPMTGIANLESVLGGDPMEWLRRWGVSVYADDLIFGEPLLQQPSWNTGSLLPVFGGHIHRLDTRWLTADAPTELLLQGGTSGYIGMNTERGSSRIRFEADPARNMKLTVLRTR